MNVSLSKKAKSITPYTAGAQPQESGIIKLNTNESPYPPSPATLEAYSSFDASDLRLYPRPDGGLLKQAIAKADGVAESCVFCGNGSDDVLAMAFAAFFDGDIMFPDVTYSFYPVWADLFGITYNLLPLNEDFTVPADKLRGNGVVLANPNAPTGIALGLDDVEKVIKQNAGYAVIVDEAYIAFGAKSAVPLIPKYENLLIVRTLSKSHALAGMRIGYALGQPRLIDGLERIKNSFNSYPLDSVAQRVGAAAMLDAGYYEESAKKIIATRERSSKQLKELGLTVLPSSANFLFVSKPGVAGAALKAYLEGCGIYVRHWNAPRIRDFLRISVGTDEQMDILAQKLRQYA